MVDVPGRWSAIVMRTNPFPSDLFKDTHLHHRVLLSTKPHRPGCHQWRPACSIMIEEVHQLNPDVIVECYLDAKYYRYDPEELSDFVDFNANLANLVEEDNVVTVENAVVDEYNLCPCVDENFKEVDNSCPSWEPNTEAVHPKWIEHHQSGCLTKDKNCPICVEEAGRRVA